MDKSKISVVLVEDHAIVRTSLRIILEESGDFHVVAEAADGAEGVRLCREYAPQLALMDMSMPVLNGLDATMELARHCPAVRVVVLSAFLEHASVVEVVRFGAKGYLLKKAGVSDLIVALRTVAAGGSYFSPEISNVLFSAVQKGNGHGRAKGLSERQTQVMRLIARGLTNKEVAAELDIAVDAVAYHRKSLRKKLGVGNAAELTRLSVSVLPPITLSPRSSSLSPESLPRKATSSSTPSAGQHQNWTRLQQAIGAIAR